VALDCGTDERLFAVARFHVKVPFEPVVHETLDSRVFTRIPDTDLSVGIRIRRGDASYEAELEVDSDRPGTAKAIAMDRVERLLSVLASWNHAFQVRTGGVRSEVIESGGTASVREVRPGLVAVADSDTVFMEDHLEAVAEKANLDAEDAFLQRYDDLPGYVRSCLELNYLLVLSTRPPNRWLLAATGLEALAIGAMGAQGTVAGRLTSGQTRELRAAVAVLADSAGIGDMGERMFQRVLSTTTGPVADHVHAYLHGLGIEDTSPPEISRWWRVRGAIAHGASIEIEQGELNRLITVFQTALRRTAGAEPGAGSSSR
jgi:hypothetical protein